jgi:hypothetical protein
MVTGASRTFHQWPLAGRLLSWCIAKPANTLPVTRRFRFIQSQPVRNAIVPPHGADIKNFSLGVRSERRAACRHQPERKTQSRRLRAGGSSGCYRASCRWFVCQKQRQLLGWRFWLVAGASEPLPPSSCGRTSLSCCVGALAAAPGSVAMLRASPVFFFTRICHLDVSSARVSFFVERSRRCPVKSSPV